MQKDDGTILDITKMSLELNTMTPSSQEDETPTQSPIPRSPSPATSIQSNSSDMTERMAERTDSTTDDELLNTNWDFDGGDIDITYSLNGEIRSGKVCSQAMILASPVWKNTIYSTPTLKNQGSDPLFTPTSSVCSSDTSTPKHLDFSEDEGDALSLLLRIVHLRFDEIPISLSSDLLLQLAKLSDRYQCLRVLKSWALPWIAATEQEGVEKLGKESWLFVYWAFGKTAEFSKISKELVLEAKVDETGNYLTARGEPLQEPTPPYIFGKVPCVVGCNKS